MSRYAHITGIFLIFCAFGCNAGVKNVLFVIVDDLRPVFGNNSEAITPNIDEFAKNSIVFTNAFAQLALCAPSRNSLLTSRRPDTLRLYDFYSYWRTFSGNYTTLPQYLKQNGYETYSIGKIFHPGESSNFTDDYPYSWSYPAYHPPTEKYKDSPVCLSERGYHADLVCPVKLNEQPGKTLPDIESTNEAIRFLKNYKNDKPFFLALGYHKPHVPFKFPENYLDLYPLDNISLPEIRQKPEKMPDIAWNSYNDLRERDDIQNINVSYPYGPIPDDWAKRIRRGYFASVTYIDSLFGKVLNELKQNNLDKNTIIVFLSDHGWSLAEHGEWAKFSNFDVSLRVTVMLKIPKLAASQLNDIIELVDIFPSLVDLLRLPSMPTCGSDRQEQVCTEGKSLLPLILGKNISATTAFSQYPRPGLHPTKHPNSDRPKLEEIKYMGYSVRTQYYRYTIWTTWQPYSANWSNVAATELYDQTNDPEENNNISNLSQNFQIQNYLHDLVISHFRK